MRRAANSEALSASAGSGTAASLLPLSSLFRAYSTQTQEPVRIQRARKTASRCMCAPACNGPLYTNATCTLCRAGPASNDTKGMHDGEAMHTPVQNLAGRHTAACTTASRTQAGRPREEDALPYPPQPTPTSGASEAHRDNSGRPLCQTPGAPARHNTSRPLGQAHCSCGSQKGALAHWVLELAHQSIGEDEHTLSRA